MKTTYKSFTLVELMIVIAILAILSAIVLFALNPIRLFDNFWDTRRVADINTINKAINFVETWNTNGISYGSTSIVYISLLDTSSTCSSYSLPTLPTGYTYSCKTQANYRKVDSTGWILIDFSINQSNSYLNVLPIDPVNDTTYFYTYYSGGSYEVTAQLANANINSMNDEGYRTGTFEMGSPNRTFITPMQRDNLVGYWKFDEESGTTAYDYSGNNYHGTLTNGPISTTTSYGERVLYFDGTDDYVVTPVISIPETGKLSIIVWANCAVQSLGQTIFGENYSGLNVGYIWWFRNGGTNNSYFRYGSSGWTSAGASVFTGYDNQWIMLSIVGDYSGEHYIKHYKNSALYSTKNDSGTMLYPTGIRARYIGAYGPGSGIMLGYIDDVRLYNRVLSSEEITDIYNKTKHKYQ